MASDNAALSPLRVVNIEDLDASPVVVCRVLPSTTWTGCRGSDHSLWENTRAFEDIYLRPRSAEALADCDLRVSVTL
jgi:hypothetical protein